MKRVLILYNFLIALNAASQWKFVGDTGFSPRQASYTFIALNPVTHQPWVAFRDHKYGKASVMKFNGSIWEYVGGFGVSDGNATCTSLAFDASGAALVAFCDYEHNKGTTVMRFDGTKWQTLGEKGFSNGFATFQSIAIDQNGVPFVAFRDGSLYSSTQAHYGTSVAKFIDGTWQYVGPKAFTNNDVLGGPFNLSLTLDRNGAPYLAYQDCSNNWLLTVQRFNGTNWENVGNPGFANWNATWTRSMAFDSRNRPHIVCKTGGRVTVMRFENGTWSSVGNESFSAAGAEYVSLSIDKEDTPYVAYQDYDVTRLLSVMKFNGSQWVYVGQQGFSPSSVTWVTMDVDNLGNVYTAFADNSTGNWRASVMTYKDKTVGITDATLHTNLVEVYPNPVGDAFNLRYSGPETDITINLVNISGQQVKSFHYENTSIVSEQCKVDDLCKGVYFAEIITRQARKVRKLLIERP